MDPFAGCATPALLPSASDASGLASTSGTRPTMWSLTGCRKKDWPDQIGQLTACSPSETSPTQRSRRSGQTGEGKLPLPASEGTVRRARRSAHEPRGDVRALAAPARPTLPRLRPHLRRLSLPGVGPQHAPQGRGPEPHHKPGTALRAVQPAEGAPLHAVGPAGAEPQAWVYGEVARGITPLVQ